MSALAEYQARLGVQLPIEYLLFLIRIGHGGAGPNYGLFSLDGHDPEDITELDQIQRHSFGPRHSVGTPGRILAAWRMSGAMRTSKKGSGEK